MPEYEANIYYHPEKYDLEIIGEIDMADSYEFDKFVVWKSKTNGQLYVGHDSGCSCPSPFEDMEFKNLTAINSKDQLASEIKSSFSDYREPAYSDVNDLINKVFPS